jgi:DNA-binding GntR family transcriptional regulator
MDAHVATLAEHAYETIREEILRGRLKPGAPLSRRRLAGEMRMSVVPIAEALRRLEDDRLVESRARAGTRVRVHTGDDVRQLYELREALETQSARLFCQRATTAQRHELRRLAEQLDVLFSRLASSGDAEFRYAVHTHHVQFHMRIAEHAHSPLVKDMIARQHVLILNWLYDVNGRTTPLPPAFHARLAEALASRDPARADEAMRAHVRFGLTEASSQIGTATASDWREARVGPAASATARAARST